MLILEELAERCTTSETDSRTVVQSAVVDLILVGELLESVSSRIRIATCNFLVGLSQHQSTAVAISAADICMRLLSLSRRVLNIFVVE